MLDLLIVNGKVIDGSGNPWFWGNVGIKEGRVVSVQRTGRPWAGGSPATEGGASCTEGDSSCGNGTKAGPAAEAAAVIDAKGMVVCPGFIDAHSHSDLTAFVNPNAESKVRQGVTTEVIGQCGYSGAPLSLDGLEQTEKQFRGTTVKVTWRSTAEYLSALDDARNSINLATLVGHGTIRTAVMGVEDRQPTPDEMEQMKAHVREAMDAGAFGLSTGLIYVPGSYSKTPEIIELAKVASRHGGLYASHIRDEGEGLLEAVEEALSIGEAAGLPVHISHHKAVGQPNWGKVHESLAMIEGRRQGGLDVTCDQYPYTATATGLSSLLPGWVHDGGTARALERLGDAQVRARLSGELDRRQEQRGGWDKILVSSVSLQDHKQYEGLDLRRISELMGLTAVEACFRLLEANELDVGMIRYGMCEEDVEFVMSHPLTMVGTDGSAIAPYGPLGEGKPHPRNYGTFPRVLGKYVRERKVLGLEEAVRKMTSLPAQRYRIEDRGLMKPGAFADVVVFDPDRVIDRATFADPHRYPDGIHYVVVNGQIVIGEGEHLGVRPGRVLRRA